MNLKKNLNKDDVAKTIDICKAKIKTTAASSVLKTKELGAKTAECFAKMKSETCTKFETLTKSDVFRTMDRRKVLKISGGVVGAAVLCAAAIIATQPTGYVLADGDKTLAYIQSPKALDEAVAVVEKELEKSTGIDEIIFEDDGITCTATKERGIEVLSDEGLQELLMESDLMKANAWALKVNDQTILAAAEKKDAQLILDSVAASYQSEGSELLSVSYKEKVEVVQEPVQVGDLVAVEDGVRLIMTGQKEPKSYVVQEGDTVWDIAIANGLTSQELQEMNPGFAPDKLKIGQELNLVEMKPYLTAVTTELVAANENIDYGTTYESSSDLYKGQTKMKSAGVCGVQKTTSQVTKENGVIVASAVMGTELVSAPQDEVVYKGTKSLSAFVGSGSLSRPVPVNVSSAFGSRGSGRHTGVDLRNPKGTPIYAADDGVVIFSAYSGTYGNIVKLSHGNGLETWYAHCETLGVSVGDVVSKGQQIATVGMTGRATGYHLHFEVRLNGVPQNPLSYL